MMIIDKYLNATSCDGLWLGTFMPWCFSSATRLVHLYLSTLTAWIPIFWRHKKSLVMALVVLCNIVSDSSLF